MTARKITAKERATSTPRLHLDPTTGATVLKVTRSSKPVQTKATPATVLGGTLPKAIAEAVKKATPVKHSALRDDKLSLRIVKMTMAERVRQQFGIGASLTEAAKATGADPAYVWDLAKIWEEKTGTRVPRSGHTPKVVATATEKA